MPELGERKSGASRVRAGRAVEDEADEGLAASTRRLEEGAELMEKLLVLGKQREGEVSCKRQAHEVGLTLFMQWPDISPVCGQTNS